MSKPERRSSGWRDEAPAPQSGERAGLPPLVLLAACRADPRWSDRAEAVEAVLRWAGGPLSVPQPLVGISEA